MTRSAVLLVLYVALAACTTVRINGDDTSSITYEGGPEVAKDLATRACQRAGQQGAEIISTVNKDPDLPAGKGKQIAIFRCVAAKQP
jgi:hypothetical protein